MTMFSQTLPSKTAQLVAMLQENNPSFLSKFYLSGGTGLSLQLGHRESEDLDFFTQETFSPVHLQSELEKYGALENLELASGTLNAFMNGVKLQFLEYPYQLLQEKIDWRNLQISSVLDIACTKLQTISMRGSKKDFIDLFFILKQFTLTDLFHQLALKYKNSNFNQAHILKSLVYFQDADQQPMPRMHATADWQEIKTEMINQVKSLDLSI